MNVHKIAGWILIADRDLRASTLPLCNEAAVFWMHSSTEGYLLAYLLLQGEDRPRTSDIAELVARCANYDAGFLEFADFACEMTSLTSYAYPDVGEDDFVDPAKAEKARAFAQRIEEFILARMPEEVIAHAEQLKRHKSSRGLDAPTGE